jgi:hypothetical protein
MANRNSAPSWKNTFNTDVAPWMWGNADRAETMARAAGYPYFTWNGWVYGVGDKAMLQLVKTEQL